MNRPDKINLHGSMMYNSEKQRRRSIRLKGYDYTQEGAYFVTICTHNRKCIFGDIVDGQLRLNEFGRLAETEWLITENIRENVEMDEYIIMPNHMHGILIIRERLVGATGPVAPTPSKPDNKEAIIPRLQPNSLGSILGQFKSVVTKKNRKMAVTDFKWQRNYYEHIIRDEDELNRIREYIIYNPLRWGFDRDNPNGNPDEQEKQFWQEFGSSDS